MLFSSLVFLFLFLPLFFLSYFAAKKRRTRNILLLCFSLVFYAWGETLHVLLMIFSIAANYFFALAIEKKQMAENQKAAKTYMALAVGANLLLIAVFKYSGFFAEIFNSLAGSAVPVPKIELPIGISFYTFQIMSYVIDVYRKQVPAQRDLLYLGAYLSGFPQLIAGPVVRYRTIAGELEDRAETISDFSAGIKRFIAGLSKKVLIANTMAVSVDRILAFSGADYGMAGAWIAMVAYAMQIYFDFSGYSDMAIGMGRMMGFHYLENFNYPYMAASITDFWRRWHISMSTFFRDYVYIPLGGSRVSRGRWVFNMAVVWACTGLWHGANWTFVIWGMYFGALLIAEKLAVGRLIEKLPVIKNIYALFLVVVGWAIFRAESVGQMGELLRAMFGGYGGGGAQIPLAALLQQSECGLVFFAMLAAAAIASMPASRFIKDKLSRLKNGALFMDVCTLTVFALCVIELALGSYNPFIYFDF